MLPELGESVTEGVVVEWRVTEGEAVRAGDTLLDVTTDKVDVEVPSPASGEVTKIVAKPGDAVAVGALLAELRTGGRGNGGAPGPAAEAPEASSDGPVAAPEAPAAPGGGTVEIVLPDMESVTEGVVVEWRVAVGEAVTAEQTVVEVSTDKVDREVP
ncbi:MAG TPA: biotin/lipoyl-containing protein, partial [Miltoncostaeaceae bacterium]|nr:biotin/lipoyl-containing protein [Miltoncostaeaceae bacterium]